jgi:hypothetical protein
MHTADSKQHIGVCIELRNDKTFLLFVRTLTVDWPLIVSGALALVVSDAIRESTRSEHKNNCQRFDVVMFGFTKAAIIYIRN